MKHNIRPQSGFTMIEVLVATTILAFAVIAVTQAVAVAQMQTYEALHDGRATSLAEAFLEEVVSRPYVNEVEGETPGPEDGEVRATYNAIDDYNGFVLDALKDTTPDVIGDVNGNAYPQTYQKFSVSITATYQAVTFFEAVPGITVTVTITDHTNRTWQMSRFIPQPGDIS